ncbi:MAG: DUF473 domain-containing protein [Methanomicrobiales archaeon]|nr:DUF473 domain-containing protein [Methanomicrobiales archaeon]
MIYAALTGINPSLIAEIKMGRPRTLELTSAHNIITLSEVNPDSLIFMTSTDMEDLAPGDGGILVHVIGLSISMKRVVEYANPLFYEERERTSARVQIRYMCSSTIKSVESRGTGQATFVDAVKAQQYCAL